MTLYTADLSGNLCIRADAGIGAGLYGLVISCLLGRHGLAGLAFIRLGGAVSPSDYPQCLGRVAAASFALGF